MFEFLAKSVQLHILIIAVLSFSGHCEHQHHEREYTADISSVAEYSKGRSFIQMGASSDRSQKEIFHDYEKQSSNGDDGGGRLTKGEAVGVGEEASDGASDSIVAGALAGGVVAVAGGMLDGSLSFTQLGRSGPDSPSEHSAPAGYRAADHQPETWQDDLGRLRAEATALKRDLNMVPDDQRETSVGNQLMLRLTAVNQELVRLSAPSFVQEPAPPDGLQARPQEQEMAFSNSQGLALQASSGAQEHDPSEYLAMPSEQPQQIQKDGRYQMTGRQESSEPTPPQAYEGPSVRYEMDARQRPRSATTQLYGGGNPTVSTAAADPGNLINSAQPPPAAAAVAPGQVGASFSRPGEAGSKTDLVEFGLFADTLYDIDLKRDSFTLDLFLKFQWPDPRAISLIPVGQTSVTFSDDEAKTKMWLPDIEITNRDIGQQSNKLVSTTINSEGLVMRSMRSLVVIRHKFLLTHYPFDEQTLVVDIASDMYSVNELKLRPGHFVFQTGASKGLLDGENYKMDDVHSSEYEDTDGTVTKSRGYLEIKMQRNTDKFLHTFLTPMVLCMVCSFAVFWLPHSPMFITPRMALSVLMLLIFRNFAVIGNEELPTGAPYNWYDLLCMNVQLNMGLIICWNIFIETASQGLNCGATGKAVNGEMKAISPMIALATFGVIFAGAGPNSALNLPSVALIVFFIAVLGNFIYISCVSSTLAAEQAHNKFLGKRHVSFTPEGS